MPHSTSFLGRTRACCTASTSCWIGCTSVPQGAARAEGPARQVRDGHAPLWSHKGIAGTLAAVNYLAEVGEQYGKDYADRFPGFSGCRLHLKTGMTVLREHDHVLSAAILDELETVGQGATVPGVQIHGITDRNRLAERVPTVSFTWGDRHPREIAAALGDQGIFVWDGNYYALAVTTRLGLEPDIVRRSEARNIQVELAGQHTRLHRSRLVRSNRAGTKRQPGLRDGH